MARLETVDEEAVRRTIGNTYVSLGEYAEAKALIEGADELRKGLEARDAKAVEVVSNLDGQQLTR